MVIAWEFVKQRHLSPDFLHPMMAVTWWNAMLPVRNVLCCAGRLNIVSLNELNCEVTANLRTYLCPLSTPEGEEDSNCRSCRNVIPRSNLVTARPAAFNRHNLIHRDIFLPYQNCEKSPLDIWYELSSNPAILPLYLLFYFSDYPWYPGKMETHFRRVSETCHPIRRQTTEVSRTGISIET